MKLKTISSAVALSLFSIIADADFSGSISGVSDYDYRGISQTAGDPALQLGLNYGHESGFYATAWGSNLDWGEGSDADIELDYTIGFSRNIGDSEVAWDAGLLFYTYPGLSSSNFTEVYGGFSGNLWHAKVSYSDDFSGLGASAWYVDGGFNYAWDNGWSVLIYGGYNFGNAFKFSHGLPMGLPDYWNWGAGVGYSLGDNLYFELKAVDTTLDDEYETERGTFENDLRGIFKVTASFP